jgi:uncharacterized 2Fe-2S/4Fe-4S cluster protein (DUF4445 family)
VAELARTGIIGKTGRFTRGSSTKLITNNDGKLSYYITGSVYLTQGDVRQVQLAKGAIRSGADALLDYLGITSEQIDRVLIAGSFGFHLREKSLLDLGMLPRVFEGKVKFVGNTSQSGAVAFLLNKELRAKMRGIVDKAHAVELNDTENFECRFVDALGF